MHKSLQSTPYRLADAAVAHPVGVPGTGWGRLSIAGGLVIAITSLCGCYGKGEIARHENVRITRPDTTPAGPAAEQVAARVPSRMNVAIFQQPNATWFFKIVGPEAQIDEHHTTWLAVVDSVAFDEAGQPQWDLPEGWERQSGGSFRYATLKNDQLEPPLEIAVSQLPPGQDLLNNVNRWLGQLSQAPVGADELEDLLQRSDRGKTEFVLFDKRGEFGQSSMGGPFSGVR